MTIESLPAYVEMYTKDYCPYCVRAKELLERKGISVQIINLQQAPQELPKMLDRSGGARTVPQIFINDQHIGGCDDLYDLDAKHQLDDLLSRSPEAN